MFTSFPLSVVWGFFFLLKITLIYDSISHLPVPSPMTLLLHLALNHALSDIETLNLVVMFDNPQRKALGYRLCTNNSVQGEAPRHFYTFPMHSTFFLLFA